MTFKENMMSLALRGSVMLQKNSPGIFLGGGIVGVTGATVLACWSTLKAQKVLEEAAVMNEQIERVRESEEYADSYSNDDYSRDKVILYVQTGAELVKLYALPVIIGTISIGMLVQSNNILNKRNAGLVAAYKAVDNAYKLYRERVREEFGDDVDDYILRKKPYEGEMMVVDKKSKKEVDFNALEDLTPEEQNMIDSGFSRYGKFFDSSSPQWQNNNEMNIFFLKAQETNANVTLQTRGHLFLNEVYDMLGIPRTRAGQVVGWVKGHGDDTVNFGIFNGYNDLNRDFVNGYNRDHILLDFNVDGWVWDIL